MSKRNEANSEVAAYREDEKHTVHDIANYARTFWLHHESYSRGALLGGIWLEFKPNVEYLWLKFIAAWKVWVPSVVFRTQS